jgi:hypothetical protein
LSLDEITEVVLPPAQPVSDTSTEAIGNPLHELSSSLTDAVDQDSPTMRLSDEEGEVSAANKPVASAAIEQVGLALDAISDVIEEINHSLPVEQMVAPKRAVQAKSTPSRSEKQKAISSKAESGWKASDGAGEEVELALKNVIAQYNVTDDEEEPQAKAKNLHSLREEPTHFVINEGGLDENADLATASKSIFGLPKETVVAVAIGGLILLGANYILFMRNDSSNTEEVSAELKADVDAALSSNRQAKPVAAIEKPFRASGTFPRGGGKVAIDAAGTKDGVTALALAFTMNPSAELTPEEIVVGKKRLPWVENVEFPAFTIEPLEKGTVEARAEGKGTLVYDNEKKRVVAAAVVEAALDMDEKNLKLLIEIGRNKESIKGDYPAAVLPDGSAAFIFKEQIDIPFDK